MHIWTCSTVVALTVLLSSPSLAIPLTPTSDLTISSQTNLTALPIPSAFKVEVQRNTNIPINPENIFSAAVDVMYGVTDFPLTDTWQSKAFPLVGGDTHFVLYDNAFGKDPSQLKTQHIIWGLNHLLLSIVISNQYCQTTVIIKWNDVSLGALSVVRIRPDTADKSTSVAITNDSAPFSSISNATSPLSLAGLSHYFDRSVNVKVVYGDKPIDKTLIYLTAIRAMGDAALSGLDTPVSHVLTQGIRGVTWQLLQETAKDTPAMMAGHSRVAAFWTLVRIRMDARWGEVYVVMSVDQKECALGGFDQRYKR
ncbi:MAG: hypothetical protein Q9220_006760 [cf. Caloplaca sp. 1 TL-2023]